MTVILFQAKKSFLLHGISLPAVRHVGAFIGAVVIEIHQSITFRKSFVVPLPPFAGDGTIAMEIDPLDTNMINQMEVPTEAGFYTGESSQQFGYRPGISMYPAGPYFHLAGWFLAFAQKRHDRNQRDVRPEKHRLGRGGTG